MLSLVCWKIAGTVPTGTSLQVLESERAATQRAEECPYQVDGRCPHAGTGRRGKRSTRSERDGMLLRTETLKIIGIWKWGPLRMREEIT